MITLIPAYGRDYKGKKGIVEDLEAGKDFQICDMSSKWDGSYCSLKDFKAGETLKIRYKKLTMIHTYKVK